MRKILTTGVAMLVLIAIAPIALYASEINVTIDGVAVDFDGQPPTIVDGRTLVPVRGVFEALGFDVGWEQDRQRVTLVSENHAISIYIGETIFVSNDVNFGLDVPAQIIEGRTMLPIRAVVESAGHNVDWDGATNTVVIARGVAEQAMTFNFALPDSVVLDTQRHSSANLLLSRTWHQGRLPDFTDVLCFEGGGGSVLEAQPHGLVGMAPPVNPEIWGGNLDASLAIDTLLVFISLDGLYILRTVGNVTEVSLGATSAVLNLPVWNKETDEFMSLFYLGQVLPNGDIYGMVLFIIFDDLDAEGVAILNEQSQRIGYDFLENAISNMENALRQIGMFN